MASVQSINPNAQVMSKANSLAVNVSAGQGLKAVLATNLGPRGTLKMLVGGAGQIKITKDGRILLHEMQIQHPTACMIARTATAQDDSTGDGTTSCVLLIGELLAQAAAVINEGVHPRVVSDGFEIAKEEALKFLDTFQVNKPEIVKDRELLASVARTSLRTKLVEELADQMTDIVVDAVLCVLKPGEPIDLHMIERMHQVKKDATTTRLVKGLVLDHGARHPDMPKHMEDVFIMTCNVSMEYESTDVNAGFYYKDAGEREKMVAAERNYTDSKVQAIIDLKNLVCGDTNKGFFICNQKGIDPMSLDMLAKNKIFAVRRAKRRNMERLMLCCGGTQINSVEEMKPEMLGHADTVWEETQGDEKWVFIEGVTNAHSCTVLFCGPNPHTIAQLKDASRDGTRSVKNAIDDLAVVAGGGAFEVACHNHLMEYKKTVKGKAKLGVEAFAKALLIIPKTLCANSGFDVMDSLLALQEAYDESGEAVGIDVMSGEPMSPATQGVWDNFTVKKHFIMLSTVIASQLLLVDEIMRAGRKMGKG